ncbi:hypothetical protein TNCV_2932911 [Trichonephila clavipes]|nr:hypothetical protein TNCV_2932911 [Trichonephila clavipes]
MLVHSPLNSPSLIHPVYAHCYAVGPGIEFRIRHGCFVNVECLCGMRNSCRAISPLVKLVEVEERWEAPDLPRYLVGYLLVSTARRMEENRCRNYKKLFKPIPRRLKVVVDTKRYPTKY